MKIILSIGHQKGIDSGAVSGDKIENTENSQIAKIAKELLTEKGFEVVLLEDMSLNMTIQKINSFAEAGDLAIEIHKDSTNIYNPVSHHRRVGFYAIKGTNTYNICEQMLKFIKSRVQENSWVRADTMRGFPLAFCRKVNVASIIYEAGFIEGDCSVDEDKFYATILTDALVAVFGDKSVSKDGKKKGK